MPLDVVTLPMSDLWLQGSGDACKAAVTLWCKAWLQVPAGSLPNVDESLATLAQMPSLRTWKKVREQALRGWVECSDGRLYHPVLARKAMEALPIRQEFLEKKSSETDRKARERDDRKRLFSELKSAGIVPQWDIRTGDLRKLHEQHLYSGKDKSGVLPVLPAPAPAPVTPSVTPPVTVHVTARTGHDTTHSFISEATLPPAPSPSGEGELTLQGLSAATPAAKPKKPQARKPPEEEGPTVVVWRAYSLAYAEVYEVDPPRNATVNGQLANLVGKLGKDEAVQLAAFYVRSCPDYRSKHHPVDLLLRDYQGLRTRMLRSDRRLPDPATARPLTRGEENVLRDFPNLAAEHLRGQAPPRRTFTEILEAEDAISRTAALPRN
jgi:hypothetical protein